MIDKQSHRFHTYSANRIGEIHSGTRPEEWYWTPGDHNIADLATRGIHPKDLVKFWHGTEYMELPLDQ